MAFKSPAYGVRPVPIEKIEANTYNPNAVAPPELKLLYDSIKILGGNQRSLINRKVHTPRPASPYDQLNKFSDIHLSGHGGDQLSSAEFLKGYASA